MVCRAGKFLCRYQEKQFYIKIENYGKILIKKKFKKISWQRSVKHLSVDITMVKKSS